MTAELASPVRPADALVKTGANELVLDVQFDDDASADAAMWSAAMQDAAAALAQLEGQLEGQSEGLIEQPCEASVRISTDAVVEQLNRDYRGKAKPTNVLSFPNTLQVAEAPSGPRHLGDIIIARGVVLAEAADASKPPLDHLKHLTIHGLLHLLGYDHETSESAALEMENLEVAILARLGIGNPYHL